MHKSRIVLSEKIRRTVAPLLADRPADAVDLSLQLKQAHWNVKGPQFIALHELFDSIHGVVSAKADMLAERLTALGGTAEGTLEQSLKEASAEHQGWTYHLSKVVLSDKGSRLEGTATLACSLFVELLTGKAPTATTYYMDSPLVTKKNVPASGFATGPGSFELFQP